MKSTIETRKELVLTLSLEEAKWLNGVMQNPLHGQSPDDEDPTERDYRHALFEATTVVNIPTWGVSHAQR